MNQELERQARIDHYIKTIEQGKILFTEDQPLVEVKVEVPSIFPPGFKVKGKPRRDLLGMYWLGEEVERIHYQRRRFKAHCRYCGEERIANAVDFPRLRCTCQKQKDKARRIKRLPLGNTFNYFTILREVKSRKKGNHRFVLCRCKCGATREHRVDRVVGGKVKSCGCIRKQNAFRKHSLSGTKNYDIWKHLQRRHQGEICPEWNDIANFHRDMGEKPEVSGEFFTLARLDDTKPFSKDNCRWMKRSEQFATIPHLMRRYARFSVKGVMGTQNFLCEHFGIKRTTVFGIRDRKKLSFEQALLWAIDNVKKRNHGKENRTNDTGNA